jgi:hypothetical protein
MTDRDYFNLEYFFIGGWYLLTLISSCAFVNPDISGINGDEGWEMNEEIKWDLNGCDGGGLGVACYYGVRFCGSLH